MIWSSCSLSPKSGNIGCVHSHQRSITESSFHLPCPLNLPAYFNLLLAVWALPLFNDKRPIYGIPFTRLNCGNWSLSTLRFLFFLATFILSYANCSLPFRNIPVRGSAQVPSALVSEPEQIIPTSTQERPSESVNSRLAARCMTYQPFAPLTLISPTLYLNMNQKGSTYSWLHCDICTIQKTCLKPKLLYIVTRHTHGFISCTSNRLCNMHHVHFSGLNQINIRNEGNLDCCQK